MPDDIADLESIRRTIVDLAIMIRDPRTPAGARRRATRAVCDTAMQAIDLAIAKLRERVAADFVP